jgi:hypothetical protein
MKCLETRTRPDGIKSRRYQLDDGRRTTTFELPASVIKAIGLKKVQEAMQNWQRGEARRTDSHARRKRIEEMLEQGIKPTAIAHEVGCTDQRVRQIRKEVNHERKRIKPTPVQREPRQVWPELRRDIQTKWAGGSPFAR